MSQLTLEMKLPFIILNYNAYLENLKRSSQNSKAQAAGENPAGLFGTEKRG
jgi:hypothetical protein